MLSRPAVVSALRTVVFVRYDIDTAVGRVAAALYQIRGVPTFVVSERSGVETFRQVGLGDGDMAAWFLELVASGRSTAALRAEGGGEDTGGGIYQLQALGGLGYVPVPGVSINVHVGAGVSASGGSHLARARSRRRRGCGFLCAVTSFTRGPARPRSMARHRARRPPGTRCWMRTRFSSDLARAATGRAPRSSRAGPTSRARLAARSCSRSACRSGAIFSP